MRASAQVERAGLCLRRFSGAQPGVRCTCAAEAAASETSGLSVGGCPERWRYFGPYPVGSTVSICLYPFRIPLSEAVLYEVLQY